jgi:hypothetical protein
MFSGLAVFGDTSFEFTSWGGNHKNGNIGLGCTSNHIFDEVSVSWSINDGENVFFSFEFP